MSDIVYSSKRTKRRHLQKKVNDILRGANQKVPKLANNRLFVSSTSRFFADNVSAVPESMITTQPLPPSLKQPVVNNKDTSSFKGKCAGMVSEINNCSDKDDGESFQPPQLACMHSEIESCSDEDDDDSFQPPLKYNIRECLALWATKFYITHIALCALLIILREHNLDIPLDARTLLATPKKTNSKSC